MYYQMIQQFCRSLSNLDQILEKAKKHAEARKFDPDNYTTLRLAPDMFTFTRQVQIACDVAKTAAAQLCGKDAPKHEDNEKTFEDVRGRIRKCLAYLETFKESDFKNVNAKTSIKMTYPQGKSMHAEEYLTGRVIPNFYFHMSTTYALLRHAGVDLGKGDFLGNLPMFDA